MDRSIGSTDHFVWFAKIMTPNLEVTSDKKDNHKEVVSSRVNEAAACNQENVQASEPETASVVMINKSGLLSFSSLLTLAFGLSGHITQIIYSCIANSEYQFWTTRIVVCRRYMRFGDGFVPRIPCPMRLFNG